MVKDKIKVLKSLHDSKIDKVRKNHNKITGFNIKSFEGELKEIEKIIENQIDIISSLEDNFTFVDKYADYFDKTFKDNISIVKDNIEKELNVFKKVTNPYYDGNLRFEKYRQFVEKYEDELDKKKGVLELLQEKLFKKSKDYKELDEIKKDIEENKEEIDETTDVENSNISHEVKEKIEETENQVQEEVTEEKLISNLKKEAPVQEEFEVKKAIMDNNIKIKVELKITNGLENTAWGFVYQKYHNIEGQTTAKSGQIKGYSKLLEMRKEYFDNLIFELHEELSNSQTAKEIEKAIREKLEEDCIELF